MESPTNKHDDESLKILRKKGFELVHTSTKTFKYSTLKGTQMMNWIKKNYGAFKDKKEKADILLQEFGCWFKNKSPETGKDFHVLFYKYTSTHNNKKCIKYKKLPISLLEYFHKKAKTDYKDGELFDIRYKDEKYLNKYFPDEKKKNKNGKTDQQTNKTELKMETITEVNPIHLNQLVDSVQWIPYDKYSRRVLGFVEGNEAIVEENSKDVQLYDPQSIEYIQTDFLESFDTLDEETFKSIMKEVEEQLASMGIQTAATTTTGNELALVTTTTTKQSNALVPLSEEKGTVSETKGKGKRKRTTSEGKQPKRKKQNPKKEEPRKQLVYPSFGTHFWVLVGFRDCLVEMSEFDRYDSLREEDMDFLFEEKNKDDLIFVLKMFALLYSLKDEKFKVGNSSVVDIKIATISYYVLDQFNVTYSVNEKKEEQMYNEEPEKIYKINLNPIYFLHESIIAQVKIHSKMLIEFCGRSKDGKLDESKVESNTKNLLKTMSTSQAKLFLIFMNKWFPLRIVKRSKHLIQNYLSLKTNDIQNTLLYI